MALKILLTTLKEFWYIPIFTLITVGGFLVLFQSTPTPRHQSTWGDPRYHRDPRAPKVCMGSLNGSVFRVPCEDIPRELLEE